LRSLVGLCQARRNRCGLPVDKKANATATDVCSSSMQLINGAEPGEVSRGRSDKRPACLRSELLGELGWATSGWKNGGRRTKRIWAIQHTRTARRDFTNGW